MAEIYVVEFQSAAKFKQLIVDAPLSRVFITRLNITEFVGASSDLGGTHALVTLHPYQLPFASKLSSSFIISNW